MTKRFIKFLDDRNSLELYLANAVEIPKNENSYLTESFSFDNSIEGAAFWEDMEDEWQAELMLKQKTVQEQLDDLRKRVKELEIYEDKMTYICNKCDEDNPCVLKVEDCDLIPSLCPFGKESIPEWV